MDGEHKMSTPWPQPDMTSSTGQPKLLIVTQLIFFCYYQIWTFSLDCDEKQLKKLNLSVEEIYLLTEKTIHFCWKKPKRERKVGS